MHKRRHTKTTRPESPTIQLSPGMSVNTRMYLWWSLCTLYLLACQVRVITGDSGDLCLCNVFWALINSLICWLLTNKKIDHRCSPILSSRQRERLAGRHGSHTDWMWTSPVNKCTPPANLPKGKIILSCGNVSYQVPFRMKWRYDTVWTAKKFLYITSKKCKQSKSYDKSNGYFTLQQRERELILF